MNNKNFIIVLAIMIIVGIVAIGSYLPSRMDNSEKVKISHFPMVIGEWQATDIPVIEATPRSRETRSGQGLRKFGLISETSTKNGTLARPVPQNE